MVLLEDLGKDLSDDYVLIKINRDVKFMDEIVERAKTRDKIHLIAWGNAINLAVRLANEFVNDKMPEFSITDTKIGTQEGVELKNNKVRPLSWIDITLSK